ncbi:hypothetical protein MEM_01823 [Candida albicans L26]|uniref:Uncharacterized protein n=1 Tax=Candida albicans P78048 TaxID=1094989 RepID=A0AB34PWV1_CANAX|nr:hypothetical protein MEU_01811 [Candida albicans P37005]KGR14944.1 hypothetical protein MG3_01820 [Candida albicans P78048]KGT70604.1 hypothetical protein MEK_01841 [Candida albicans 12C]KGU15210.1 hypothetical protein MEM_01823 [Candida albicans L26]KHC59526.1 putative phosphopantothenoylcysteine decarboxylase-like protein [Candida albicans P37039]
MKNTTKYHLSIMMMRKQTLMKKALMKKTLMKKTLMKIFTMTAKSNHLNTTKKISVMAMMIP